MTDIEKILVKNELRHRYELAEKFFERQAVLRQYYMEMMPEIMSTGEKSKKRWVDGYPFNWEFNKNERNLWHSIRTNQVVFYPEFPVFSFFVDFGNPFLKIGLEADSKAFHDVEKDKKRDLMLSKVGWTIFRLSYHESNRELTGLGELREKQIEMGQNVEAQIQDLILNSSEGVVQAIQYFYFNDNDARNRTNELFPSFRTHAEETLHNHCNTELELPKIN